MKTKLVFCAAEQQETEHAVTIDNNGEYVFTCPCGRFIKLPAELSGKEITSQLKNHAKANEGVILAEEVERANAEKLAKLDES